MEFCGCVTNEKGEWKKRLSDIWDERVEISEVKSMEEFWDECSDVVFGFGRLLGYFCGVKYVHLYGAEACLEKKKKRMAEYGCTRSKRHLVCGMCRSKK